jgi:hypothetical protein
VRTMTATYKPIAGTSPWTSEAGAALAERFCVPPAIANDLATKAANGSPVSVSWVHYSAHAGATARGAAASYRVAIETAGAEKAFTCRDGLKGGTTSSREASLSGHSADDEIHVLFVE